jgi:hypothetical protein
MTTGHDCLSELLNSHHNVSGSLSALVVAKRVAVRKFGFGKLFGLLWRHADSPQPNVAITTCDSTTCANKVVVGTRFVPRARNGLLFSPVGSLEGLLN